MTNRFEPPPTQHVAIHIDQCADIQMGNGEVDAEIWVTRSADVRFGRISRHGQGRVILADEVKGLMIEELHVSDVPNDLVQAILNDVRERNFEGFMTKLLRFAKPESYSQLFRIWGNLGQ